MKPDYITVSFSGGKDSTAMLLHMIELGEHIDEVINIDTGMEFPAMYDHIDKVRQIVESHGIRFQLEERHKKGMKIDSPGFYRELRRVVKPLPESQTHLTIEEGSE